MAKVIRKGLVYITCHLNYYNSVFLDYGPIKSFTDGYLSSETKQMNLIKQDTLLYY
jgi:hypothetical protein